MSFGKENQIVNIKQVQSKGPVVFTKTYIMRKEMSESEPLSDYSEPMLPPQQTNQPQLRMRIPQIKGEYHLTRSPIHSAQSTPYSPRPGKSSVMQSLPPNFSVKSPSNVTRTKPQGSKVNSMDRDRFFIGTIEQLVRWHKIAKPAEFNAIYEISAIIENMFFNSTLKVYNMTLKAEKKTTPSLQATFYPIDRDIPTVESGQHITCVGRMVGSNKLQVFDMWPAASQDLIGLQRTSFLCQRTVQELNVLASKPGIN